MAHIQLEEHLPGVTGLLEYRKDTALPLRELTHILLRGENSLSEAERELIATAVCNKNECKYCTTAHAAATDIYFGESGTTLKILNDIENAHISPKMKALLTIALQVQDNGKKVTPNSIAKAKAEGASDMEIHDTVMIAALFSFYNRYVDGLGTFAPDDPTYYAEMAVRLKERGYIRPKEGYDNLKDKFAKN